MFAMNHPEQSDDDVAAESTLDIDPDGQNSLSCFEDPISLEFQFENETNSISNFPTREEREIMALFEESENSLESPLAEPASCSEAIPGRFIAKATSNPASYAAELSHQAPASIPMAVPPLVSPNWSGPSYQSKLHTVESCVDRGHLSSSSPSAANQGLYHDPLADVQNFWPPVEELQGHLNLGYPQAQEHVRIEPHESYSECLGTEPQLVEQPQTANVLESPPSFSSVFPQQFLQETHPSYCDACGKISNPRYVQDIRQDMNLNHQSLGPLQYSTERNYGQPIYSVNTCLEQPNPAYHDFRQQYPVMQENRRTAYQPNGLYGMPFYEPSVPELEEELEQEIKPAKQSGRGKVSKAPQKLVRPNKRSANIANFKPSEYYQDLPQAPQSWGTINPDTCQPTFAYTAKGELVPTLKFTKAIMEEYLSNCFDNPLTLWVQVCPADSGNRYSHQDTSKCRFVDCPIKNNTISKGDFRVTLDEHSSSKQLRLDPFNNAGYVHLFCLEKFFDFPLLCKDFNVKPDKRVFRKEVVNKMAITRDYPEMAQVVLNFIANAQSQERQKWEYSKTLCYALTVELMLQEPATRQRTRERRGGNSVDKHFNNLDIKATNAVRMKSQGRVPLIVFERPTINTRKISRRKFGDENDTEAGPAAKKSKREAAAQSTSPIEKRHTSRRQFTKRRSNDKDAEVLPSFSELLDYLGQKGWGPLPRKHKSSDKNAGLLPSFPELLDYLGEKGWGPLPKKRKSSDDEDSENSLLGSPTEKRKSSDDEDFEDSLFGSPTKKRKVMKTAKSSSSAKKLRKEPARQSSPGSSSAKSSASIKRR